MSDLISRQDAIDALYAEFEYVYCYNCDHEGNEEWCEDCHRKYMKWSASRNTIERVLNDLPSAQPELAQNLHTTCTDAISRQAAIEAIHEDADWLAAQGSDWQVERMERDKSILKSLPSAEPERKKGKWLRSGNSIFPYECDQCGDTNERATPFCPHCGADMREGGRDEAD